MPEGRPPKYKTPEDMQKAIDAYFASPPTVTVVQNGTALDLPKVTVTGLALHLGFESRQSFYDYESNPAFSYTIKRARTRIEHEYEKMLTCTSAAGPIFALKNFGWKDKTEVEQHTYSHESALDELE